MLPCPIDGSYPFCAIQRYQVASQSPRERNTVSQSNPLLRGRRDVQPCMNSSR